MKTTQVIGGKGYLIIPIHKSAIKWQLRDQEFRLEPPKVILRSNQPETKIANDPFYASRGSVDLKTRSFYHQMCE